MALQQQQQRGKTALSLVELEQEAKDRLALLLDFTKEIATLGRRDAEPVTQLRTSSSSARLVLHESSFRELLGLRSEDGRPALTLTGNGAAHATSSSSSSLSSSSSSSAVLVSPSGASLVDAAGARQQPGVWLTLHRPDPSASTSKSQAKGAKLARAANDMCVRD